MIEVGSWSKRGYGAGINCNLVPGVVLKGANLSIKNTHTHGYRDLFAEWDWAGWIKPQVDCAKSIGSNVVRLIGDLEGVNDGTFTTASYYAKWAQLVDYATSQGMYTYLTGGGPSQITNGALTTTQLADTLAGLGAAMDSRKARICGYDLVQESVRLYPANSPTMPIAGTLSAAVRGATSIPITYSYASLEDAGASRWANPLWIKTLDPYVDYWDMHVYHDAQPAMVHEAFWSRGVVKPIIVGEFGMNVTNGHPAQQARYQNMLNLCAARYDGLHLAGALAWSVFEDGYGMFNNDGTPRTWLTDLFQQLPTT